MNSVLFAAVTSLLPLKQYAVITDDERTLTAVLSPGATTLALQIGDRVEVELSPYDPSICRIVNRLKTPRPTQS